MSFGPGDFIAHSVTADVDEPSYIRAYNWFSYGLSFIIIGGTVIILLALAYLVIRTANILMILPLYTQLWCVFHREFKTG